MAPQQQQQQPQDPILIVDDEENQIVSMAATLRLAGYNNLRFCLDSRDVLGMLSRETFSLMIIDLIMPHVMGHEIILQSAALKHRPPILIVSGSSDTRDYGEAMAGGVIGYMVKPVDRERLIAVVRNALSCSNGNHKLSPFKRSP